MSQRILQLLLLPLGATATAEIVLNNPGNSPSQIVFDEGTSDKFILTSEVLRLLNQSCTLEVQSLKEQLKAIKLKLGLEFEVTKDGLELLLDASINQANGHPASNWKDLSGNNHDFSSSGASYDAAQKAYLTDGGGFRAPSWPSFNSASEMTVEVWAKLRGYKSYNTGIFSNFLGGGGKCNFMWTNSQKMHNNGFKGSTYSGNVGYNTNSWYRFALRYQTNVGYEFFLNDDKVHTQSASGSLSISPSGTTYVGIGNREDNVETANAYFSVVLWYSRALSDAELTSNFNAFSSKFGL